MSLRKACHRQVIEPDLKDLRQIQLIELELLVELDRICRKNEIKYSLDGGTLIGAVRHQGFIPWDDDIDIILLHDEYERFYEACKTDLDTSRFFFQDHRTDPGYRWGYGKLRRIGTEYIKIGQENLKQKTGICIDIFDFENIPDGKRERKRFFRQMYCIRKILYSAVGRTEAKSIFLRIWYSLLYLLPVPFIYRIKNHITAKYNDQKTENVLCPMMPLNGCEEGVPRVCFDGYVDLDFDGMKAMALQGYDQYLHMQYGDYMTLPPEDQRKGVLEAVEYKLIDITHQEIMEKYHNG